MGAVEEVAAAGAVGSTEAFASVKYCCCSLSAIASSDSIVEVFDFLADDFFAGLFLLGGDLYFRFEAEVAVAAEAAAAAATLDAYWIALLVNVVEDFLGESRDERASAAAAALCLICSRELCFVVEDCCAEL